MLKGGGAADVGSPWAHTCPGTQQGILKAGGAPPGAPARVMQGGPLYLEEANEVRGPTRHAPKTSLPAPSPTHVDPAGNKVLADAQAEA